MRIAGDEELLGRVDDLIASLGWDIANRYHIGVTTIEHVTNRVSLVNGKRRSQSCVC